MNKGITAKQVARVMGIPTVLVNVHEWSSRGVGPRYSLTFDEDVDFSMHEVVALAALFGATGISAIIMPNSGSGIEVTET